MSKFQVGDRVGRQIDKEKPLSEGKKVMYGKNPLRQWVATRNNNRVSAYQMAAVRMERALSNLHLAAKSLHEKDTDGRGVIEPLLEKILDAQAALKILGEVK